MLFAFDYDGTWSKDAETFEELRSALEARGHTVVIVTARADSNPVPVDGVPIHYTDGDAKKAWSLENDLHVDVWIDNDPWMIVHGAPKNATERLSDLAQRGIAGYHR